jgi:hypothetical protein
MCMKKEDTFKSIKEVYLSLTDQNKKIVGYHYFSNEGDSRVAKRYEWLDRGRRSHVMVRTRLILGLEASYSDLIGKPLEDLILEVTSNDKVRAALAAGFLKKG